MPWCSTVRRSRSGRNISVPAISTISSAVRLISPCCTRQAPSASAAAAPSAVPRSVKPRVSTLSASTQNVLSRQRARLVGQHPAVGVALAERLQRRQALHRVEELLAERLERACRARDARPERSCTTAGSTRVNSAATSMTSGDRHVPEGDEGEDRQRRGRWRSPPAACTGRRSVCNCSTPSTIDSMTPPVRSAPNQAGPRATILSYSRPRSASCTRMAVRCATMVRPWSSAARSTMATPAPASGQTSTAAGRALEHAGQEPAEEDEAGDAEGQRQQAQQRPTAQCAAGSPAVMRQRVRSKCMSSGLLARPHPVRPRARRANDCFSIAVELDCTAMSRRASLPWPPCAPLPRSRGTAASPAPRRTLHVSTSAVSHQVRGLEDTLGRRAADPGAQRRRPHRGHGGGRGAAARGGAGVRPARRGLRGGARRGASGRC